MKTQFTHSPRRIAAAAVAGLFLGAMLPALSFAERPHYGSIDRNSRWVSNNQATHAGQEDTDGILSPGEIRNPNINYDKAQRQAERRGDYRVENPDNNAAASADRRFDRTDWDQAERDREERAREDRRLRDENWRDRYRDDRRGSFWGW